MGDTPRPPPVGPKSWQLTDGSVYAPQTVPKSDGPRMILTPQPKQTTQDEFDELFREHEEAMMNNRPDEEKENDEEDDEEGDEEDDEP